MLCDQPAIWYSTADQPEKGGIAVLTAHWLAYTDVMVTEDFPNTTLYGRTGTGGLPNVPFHPPLLEGINF